MAEERSQSGPLLLRRSSRYLAGWLVSTLMAALAWWGLEAKKASRVKAVVGWAMWAWWSRGLRHGRGAGEGRDRQGLVRGVVASSAGGSGTLRSGAQETDLEEGPGSGSEEGSTGGSKEDVVVAGQGRGGEGLIGRQQS